MKIQKSAGNFFRGENFSKWLPFNDARGGWRAANDGVVKSATPYLSGVTPFYVYAARVN
jgi:hypothetical protein